jgi:hypothetical protein
LVAQFLSVFLKKVGRNLVANLFKKKAQKSTQQGAKKSFDSHFLKES